MSIQVGSKVRLKGGGPTMVVQEINEKGCVCRWFKDHDEKSLVEVFPMVLLENWDDDGEGFGMLVG